MNKLHERSDVLISNSANLNPLQGESRINTNLREFDAPTYMQDLTPPLNVILHQNGTLDVKWKGD